MLLTASHPETVLIFADAYVASERQIDAMRSVCERDLPQGIFINIILRGREFLGNHFFDRIPFIYLFFSDFD